MCVKLYVACAVCSVRRAHDEGHGRAEHMCSRGEPLETQGLLCDAQGGVMAACMVGIRQEGNPCRMVPSERDEVRETRTAAMTSRERCAVVNCRASAQVANCRAGGVHI